MNQKQIADRIREMLKQDMADFNALADELDPPVLSGPKEGEECLWVNSDGEVEALRFRTECEWRQALLAIGNLFWGEGKESRAEAAAIRFRQMRKDWTEIEEGALKWYKRPNGSVDRTHFDPTRAFDLALYWLGWLKDSKEEAEAVDLSIWMGGGE